VIEVLNVQINEEEVRQIYLDKLEERMKEFDGELVFWDSKELCRRTCMSWNFIQEQFFFDPRFPKTKVKSKWLFPAIETKDFLVKWLREQ
jgi:hypothetical protein